MVGIDDVARRAGVSTATVSRVLNGKNTVAPGTAEKVFRAVDELDYVMSAMASGLASGRTKNVGVIVPDLSRWYFANIVDGVAAELLHYNYDLTVYTLGAGRAERKQVFEQSLLRQRVDGFIAISQELTQEEATQLRELKKPIVGVGGPIPGVHTLGVDEREVARRATQVLIDLGHQRIAHLGGTQEFEADFNVPAARRSGYQDALAAAGLSAEPQLQANADFTIPGGYEATLQLLTLGLQRPTAIFAASDEMAIGAIFAIRAYGLTPGVDISIIGIDNHELAEFVGLSTVAQYPHEQGSLAVTLLMEELNLHQDESVPHGPAPTVAVSPGADSLITPLRTELLVRSSTGPVPVK